MRQPAVPFRRGEFLLVVLAISASQVVRAWLAIEWREDGISATTATNLASLASYPVLVLLLLPVVWRHRHLLARAFRPADLTWRLLVVAVATGVLARIGYWAWLVSGIALGGQTMPDDAPFQPWPVFVFECPPAWLIGLGLLTVGVLTPLTEEISHRGLIQSTVIHRGKWTAIFVSAMVFTLFHRPDTYSFVLVMGFLLGLQYANTGSLWFSLVTHITYNCLIQFDWICLRGQWRPDPGGDDMQTVGTVAAATFALSLGACFWLAGERRAGALTSPRPG